MRIAGLVASMIAGSGYRWAAYALAGLVAIATLANLLLRLGAEPVWYKIGTLVMTVTSILLVSRLRSKPGT